MGSLKSDSLALNKEEVSVLGISWFPQEDNFGLQIDFEKYAIFGRISCSALSIISKTFDPLGAFFPC